jgi:hypothetical protein
MRLNAPSALRIEKRARCSGAANGKGKNCDAGRPEDSPTGMPGWVSGRETGTGTKPRGRYSLYWVDTAAA